MNKLRNGKYRNLVTIQNDSGADGDELPTWATFMDDVPAARYDVGGGEVFRGKQMEANVTAVFEMRYYDGITEEMQIVSSGRTYSIQRIIDRGGMDRYLEIQATETK